MFFLFCQMCRRDPIVSLVSLWKAFGGLSLKGASANLDSKNQQILFRDMILKSTDLCEKQKQNQHANKMDSANLDRIGFICFFKNTVMRKSS